MRGNHYSSDDRLAEEDMRDLVDSLAHRLHSDLGHRVYALSRQDVGELIARYIADLDERDQKDVPWLVWDLIQDGLEELTEPVGVAGSYVFLFWFATIILGIMLGLMVSRFLGII